MSLNGLDDPSIIESYQSALAEAGGWFLLKYVSRDVVALLHKGTGGVVEIRSTITAYEEKSPLYGFLQYRRRKIILRYVPEGISRLIQARITVQFQSILDRFSPHDTVFSLTTPSELTENALSSTCMLHTASGSMTSSTSSLRQRRLGEITEDAEENGPDEEERIKRVPTSSSHSRAGSVFSGTSEATAVPSHSMLRDGPSKGLPDGVMLAPEALSHKPLPSAPGLSSPTRANGIPQQHLLDQLSQPLPESRTSSQSVRPSLHELDQITIRRPKVRLGPRPSLDASGRPKTAGSMTRSYEPRPVASLPAGMRSRKQSTSRPKSQPDYEQPGAQTQGTVPPVPPLLVPPPVLIGSFSRNAPSSPRSIRSCATTIGMTPEKQRLMRALELRKQQMARQPKRAESKAESKTPEQLLEAKGQRKDDGEISSRISPKGGSAFVGPTIDKDAANTPQAETAVVESRKITTSPELHETVQTPSSEASTPDSAVELSPSHHSVAVGQKKAYVSSVAAPLIEKEVDLEPTPPQTPPEELELLKPVAYAAPKMTAVHPAPSPQTDQMSDQMVEPVVEESSSSLSSPPTLPQGSLDASLSSSVTSHSIEKSSVVTSSSSTLRNVSDTESDALSKHTVFANSSQSSIADEIPDPVDDNAPKPEAETEEDAPALANGTAAAASTAPAPGTEPESDLGSDTPTPRSTTDEHSELKVEEAPVTVPSPIIQVDDREVSDNTPEATEESNTNKDADTAVASQKEKRIAMLDPIQIPSNASNAEEDILLSDDSFMDELGSATLQEARPITIPRTPTSSSGKGASSADRWNGSRMVSNSSVRSDIEALPVGVASSRAFFESEKSAPVLVAKKVNVSSGISKRIKALEMFSSREAGAIPDKASNRPEPQKSASPSAFEKFRKRTSISQSPGSLSPSPSNLALPQAADAASGKNGDSKSSNRPKSKSVSVTARIVRGASASASDNPSDSEPNSLNLHRSEITVEQNGEKSAQASNLSIRSPEKRHSICSSGAGSKRNSFTGPKSPSIDTTNKTPITRPMFDAVHSPSSSDTAHGNAESIDETKEDKKGSRKSRIIRRMSSITTNPLRKSTAKDQKGPAPPQTPMIQESPASNSTPIHVVDVGEVNVQFPDTLLWKRRFMRVDESGYLILTPGTIDGNPRNTVKRYHLSEFRRPYVPDHDRQELPNSILLDFCDGNTLQCACESKQGQSLTLQTLIDAHHAYTQ